MKIQQLSNTSKRYTAREKMEYVLYLVTGAKTLKQVQQETGISKQMLIAWKKHFFAKGHQIFEHAHSPEQKEKEKKRIIEMKNKEIALLKKIIDHCREFESKKNFNLPDS